MSTHRPTRIDRATAERLLSGAVVDPQDGPEALVRLLAATRATARPSEFAGENVALEAFRAANLGLVLQPRRRSMLQIALAKLLTLKVATTAAVAVAATGGVAVAASSGVLPNPLGSDAPKATPSAQATSGPEDAAEAKGSASPSPSLVGLCRAYKAGAGDNPGKALENPAFSVLITTAGDQEKVAAYCDTLLAAQKGDKAPAGPSARPDVADTHPTAKPDSHPTGAPDVKPTGAPANHVTPPVPGAAS